MEVLSRTKNGQVYICKKCNMIHIEYGNLNFNFSKKEFEEFANYIINLDGAFWQDENKYAPFNRKIIIPIGHKNFNVLLSLAELNEMKSLFKFWSKIIRHSKIRYKDINSVIHKN